MSPQPSRCIFHIDMDAFFASVEVVKDPSLKGKPVIVGGRPDQRGVVSTCSYEARAFGVHSAMPVNEAYRLCPYGIFIEGNFDSYKEYSERVFDIFYQYTPFVEGVSIDEAYLDVSNLITTQSSPYELASQMKNQVLSQTGLTCSIGIATSKLVAKVASSAAKPNGICEVSAGTEAAFLAPLPIQALLGVGEKTKELFNRQGITTISDLQDLSRDELIRDYGSWGYHYFLWSRGEDTRPVQWEDSLPKSIGAETTFERDLSDCEVIREAFRELIEKAYRRMAAHKMRTKRISLKLRYNSFKTITRSSTLPTHVKDLKIIEKAALELLNNHYKGNPPLRLIGVSLEKLTNGYWQPMLF